MKNLNETFDKVLKEAGRDPVIEFENIHNEVLGVVCNRRKGMSGQYLIRDFLLAFQKLNRNQQNEQISYIGMM